MWDYQEYRTDDTVSRKYRVEQAYDNKRTGRTPCATWPSQIGGELHTAVYTLQTRCCDILRLLSLLLTIAVTTRSRQLHIGVHIIEQTDSDKTALLDNAMLIHAPFNFCPLEPFRDPIYKPPRNNCVYFQLEIVVVLS